VDRSARGTVLAPIVAAKRREAERLRAVESGLRARSADLPPARGFAGALRRSGEVAVIAELKRRSPSAGWIREGADAGEIAAGYESAGAAALSVLTDHAHFGGSLDDLAVARGAVRIPVLRKDFVVAPAQVYEARVAGADAVLLIARILEGGQLGDLLGLAGEVGLDVLVETHDESELETALAVGARVIGINNRDLDTLQVDRSLALRLAPRVPADRVVVAESGIAGAEHVGEAGARGIDAVLVGETLMRAPDPAAALAELVGHAKAAQR
jgi:indole-3-glycerol phosphate synthase